MASSIIAKSAAEVTKMVTSSAWTTTGVVRVRRPNYLIVLGPKGERMGADTEHRGPYSSDTAEHCAANWIGSILMNWGRSTFIHPLDTGDKGVSNSVSLECLKEAVVGDLIEIIFEIKGKYAQREPPAFRIRDCITYRQWSYFQGPHRIGSPLGDLPTLDAGVVR